VALIFVFALYFKGFTVFIMPKRS